MGRFSETYTDPKFSAIEQTSNENSRLSSLPAAKVVSTEGTSAPQRQKFHTDDVNKCYHSKSHSHGVPNVNLFDLMFLLVNYG